MHGEAIKNLLQEKLSEKNTAPLHVVFALTGSIVILIWMLLIGWWVSRAIEDSVTRNSAISTALYMEGFISPLSQGLSSESTLSEETIEELNALMTQPHFEERIRSVKIWIRGGRIAFASNQELIGRQFEPSQALRAAWQGELSASFDDLNDEEDAAERLESLPFLEVYNPIHSYYNGEVIAVAEFYQIATELEQDIFDARLKSWFIVAGASVAMFTLLFVIVFRGSRLIEKQSKTLEQRFQQLKEISTQNDFLRRRVQAASSRASELNERFLKRISAELHDGPAQSMAFASLRMESIGKGSVDDAEVMRIKSALDEALADIRNISRGLSLPEIADLSIDDVVKTAVRAHELRSKSQVELTVECDVGADPLPYYDHAAKICVFRFVQEALNNAFHHAGGKGQSVNCKFENGEIKVRVSDNGKGFDPRSIDSSEGLGLRGLRERIESHGGKFSVNSRTGYGTWLEMTMGPGEERYA